MENNKSNSNQSQTLFQWVSLLNGKFDEMNSQNSTTTMKTLRINTIESERNYTYKSSLKDVLNMEFFL